jgi:hypothetical protein
MKDMMGIEALVSARVFSMNMVMAGMIPAMVVSDCYKRMKSFHPITSGLRSMKGLSQGGPL